MTRLILALTLALAFPATAHAVPSNAHLTHSQLTNWRIVKKTLKAEHVKKPDRVAMKKLAWRESRLNRLCKTGHYRGIFQLGFNGMGTRWKNVAWNTRRALKYIKARYGTPRRALAHSYRYTWY